MYILCKVLKEFTVYGYPTKLVVNDVVMFPDRMISNLVELGYLEKIV
jgi:hypothetical protein